MLFSFVYLYLQYCPAHIRYFTCTHSVLFFKYLVADATLFASIFYSNTGVGMSTLDIQYIWLGVALWTVELTGCLLAVDPSCDCVEVKTQGNELTRGTTELVQNIRL